MCPFAFSFGAILVFVATRWKRIKTFLKRNKKN